VRTCILFSIPEVGHRLEYYSRLHFHTRNIYFRFVWENTMLALEGASKFQQPCSSAGHRFAVSRLRLDPLFFRSLLPTNWFISTKNDLMKCFINWILLRMLYPTLSSPLIGPQETVPHCCPRIYNSIPAGFKNVQYLLASMYTWANQLQQKRLPNFFLSFFFSVGRSNAHALSWGDEFFIEIWRESNPCGRKLRSPMVSDPNHLANRVYTICTECSHHICSHQM